MYTCYAIPFNAFASTMTQSTEERTKLNSIRFAIVAIPSLIISIATPYLKSGQTGNTSYSRTALIFALIATFATLICVRGIVERATAPKKSERTTGERISQGGCQQQAAAGGQRCILPAHAGLLHLLFRPWRISSTTTMVRQR